jgi:antitoxin YefM
MRYVSYTQLRQSLASIMDEVCSSRAPLLVTLQKAPAVVMIAAEEWESIAETLHLLSSPRNAALLMESIAQADAGELVEHPPVA